jgi:hypothetical protein
MWEATHFVIIQMAVGEAIVLVCTHMLEEFTTDGASGTRYDGGYSGDCASLTESRMDAISPPWH